MPPSCPDPRRATSSTPWWRSCARCASSCRPSSSSRSRTSSASVLLLLRAVIDYWVERLDAPRPAEVEVQDIPIA